MPPAGDERIIYLIIYTGVYRAIFLSPGFPEQCKSSSGAGCVCILYTHYFSDNEPCVCVRVCVCVCVCVGSGVDLAWLSGDHQIQIQILGDSPGLELAAWLHSKTRFS